MSIGTLSTNSHFYIFSFKMFQVPIRAIRPLSEGALTMGWGNRVYYCFYPSDNPLELHYTRKQLHQFLNPLKLKTIKSVHLHWKTVEFEKNHCICADKPSITGQCKCEDVPNWIMSMPNYAQGIFIPVCCCCIRKICYNLILILWIYCNESIIIWHFTDVSNEESSQVWSRISRKLMWIFHKLTFTY